MWDFTTWLELFVIALAFLLPLRRKPAPRDDNAVTPVLGTLLMLAMLMMLLIPASMWLQATTDVMTAERERAEQAAWCVRHPHVGEPACPSSVMPGYDCRVTAADVYVCAPKNATGALPR